MDFIKDSFFQVKPFRAFKVIDDLNRETLNINIAKSNTSERVIAALEQLIAWRGKPEKIPADNGPEFIANALEQWCKATDRKIELGFIEKGKLSQNGCIERFNETFGEDILDAYLFEKLTQVHASSNR
jgi:putative transposase